jgi:hypothetical protein
VTPTGGTLAAGGWPAVVRLTLKLVGTQTVVNGGTGYTASDSLTFTMPAGGTAVALTATVSSGVVTALSIATAGVFQGNAVLPGTGGVPQNPVTLTGGTGTGCTVNLNWGLATAVVDDSGNYSVLPTGYTITSVDGNGASGALAVGAAVAFQFPQLPQRFSSAAILS